MKFLWAKRIRTGVSFLLFIFLMLPVCWAGTLPFPADACEELWKENSDKDYLFQYPGDRVESSFGNIGYSRYQERMAQKGLNRKDCHKKWTVLIYMAAASDLERWMVSDLVELESHFSGAPDSKYQNGSSLKTDVLVQFQPGTEVPCAGRSNRGLDPDPRFGRDPLRPEERSLPSLDEPQLGSLGRRLHLFESPDQPQRSLTPEELAELKIENVHSPVVEFLSQEVAKTTEEKLLDFLKWGIEEYPSDFYFVVVAGHGRGWTSTPSGFAKQAAGGIAILDSGSYLDIPGLKRVLGHAKEWIGDRINVFACDSCLMQTVENAVELNECAEFLCGSEDVESSAGLLNSSLLCHMNQSVLSPSAGCGDEPFRLAQLIPRLYAESFDAQTGSQRLLDPRARDDLTCSSIQTKHLRTTLLPSLNRLGDALVDYVKEDDFRWMDLRALVQTGAAFEGGTQDLGQFLKSLSDSVSEQTSPAALILKRRIRQAFQALRYTVVGCALGQKYQGEPGLSSGSSAVGFEPQGISIWLPPTDEVFQARIADFDQSDFYQPLADGRLPGWRAWMSLLYSG